MASVTDHTIAARVHGRYLVRAARAARRLGADGPAPLLVGFHGYGETAEDHLAELERIPGTEAWTLVAVQALHPFYTRDGEKVVASWMTRLDRELAIADNTAYAISVVAAMTSDAHDAPPRVAFSGFSQGVAMAYRAAAALAAAGDAGAAGAARLAHGRGVIALAGDMPPEIDPGVLPSVLIGRGSEETWYDEAKLAADRSRLEAAGVAFEVCLFDGGHEWTDPFRQAAGAFLERAAAAHHS